MTPETALATYEDVAAVTEALNARLCEGDVDGAAGLAQQREALVARLSETPPPLAAMPTIERIISLDQELMQRLEEAKRETHVALRGLAVGRQGLRTYRGAPATSPAFVDRVG